MSLRQKALHETHNYGLGEWGESRTGGKDVEQRRRVSKGGRKDSRRAVVCAIAILREEKGMHIGVIKVICCNKLTCDSLAREFG